MDREEKLPLILEVERAPRLPEAHLQMGQMICTRHRKTPGCGPEMLANARAVRVVHPRNRN